MILRIKAIQYNPDRSCTVFMEDNTYKFFICSYNGDIFLRINFNN